MTDARRTLRLLAFTAVVSAALALAAAASSAKTPPAHDLIAYHGWTNTADFASGSYEGTQPAHTPGLSSNW